MSDAEQRKEVFAWFGAASYYAQCVETELWIARLFVARIENPERTEQEWQEIEGEPLTISRLLGLIRRGISLDADETKVLETCRKKRNWLAHNYWEERSHLLATAEGCVKAVDELMELYEVFKRGDEVARNVSARIRARIGISEEAVENCKRNISLG